MPEVIINDERFEAHEGESLMEIGRRNGAHLGFWCSGRGLCTFCECHVKEGNELLNPITGNERARLSAARLQNGSRLACRAVVEAKEGTIRVITRSEKIKRQFLRTFTATSWQASTANLFDLGSSIMQLSSDYLSMYPYVLKSLGKGKVTLDTLNPFKDVNNLLRDGRRVIAHQLKSDKIGETTSPD
jgi:ferredoxin